MSNLPRQMTERMLDTIQAQFAIENDRAVRRDKSSENNKGYAKIKDGVDNIYFNVTFVGIPRTTNARRGRWWLNKDVRGSHITWFLKTGRWPDKPLDFIDGNRLNIAFSNLREFNHKGRKKGYKRTTMVEKWSDRTNRSIKEVV